MRQQPATNVTTAINAAAAAAADFAFLVTVEIPLSRLPD
jgi:HAMP domain-containing protein